jgi:hypothetical protein
MDLRSGLPAAGRDLYRGQGVEEPKRPWAKELSGRSGHEEAAPRKQLKRIHVGSRVRSADGTILDAALRWPAERWPEPGQMVWAGRDASVTGYQRGAGLPRMRFHDLRHAHASLLLAAGVHPKVVQERLGHSQVSVTLDTYSHVAPARGAQRWRQKFSGRTTSQLQRLDFRMS